MHTFEAAAKLEQYRCKQMQRRGQHCARWWSGPLVCFQTGTKTHDSEEGWGVEGGSELPIQLSILM